MELYKNIWDDTNSINQNLEFINFFLKQYEESRLTLSDIQHKKIIDDIDHEELIKLLFDLQVNLQELTTKEKSL